jgi:hypothetical protein
VRTTSSREVFNNISKAILNGSARNGIQTTFSSLVIIGHECRDMTLLDYNTHYRNVDRGKRGNQEGKSDKRVT